MAQCKYEYKVGEQRFRMGNLGGAINQQFVGLSEYFLANKPFNRSAFCREAGSYFNNHQDDWASHNNFFEGFTPIWQVLLRTGRLLDAYWVWELAVECATEWESTNPTKHIHKGTPYYFWGMTAVMGGDLDRGFLLMHQALSEDVQLTGLPVPNTPAAAFATLDYQKQDQAFRFKVQEIAESLDSALEYYRKSRNRALTIGQLRIKLLQSPDLLAVAFNFVFILFRLHTLLKKVEPVVRRNDFAALLATNLLFNLCLVLDATMGNKNTRKWRFLDHAEFLSLAAGLNINRPQLTEINNAFNNDFPSMVGRLLSGKFVFKDGQVLSESGIDLSLAYGFRNFGAHKVEGFPIVYQNFEEIAQRLMNVLFLALECLYP